MITSEREDNMIDGMGNSINGTPMGARPIPPQFKALSEAAAVRVAAMTQTIRSLDGNIAALSESKLRRRCRAAQAGLLNCCTGISLAERERERLYHRSSPALGMLVEREVEPDRGRGVAQRFGRLRPLLVGADGFALRARRELEIEIVKPVISQ